MNYKQKELVDKFISIIKDKYPLIDYLHVTESPDDPNDLWVHFYVPYDENIQTEISEFAGMLSSDFLVEYGWLLIIYQHQTYRPAMAA